MSIFENAEIRLKKIKLIATLKKLSTKNYLIPLWLHIA